MPPDFEPKRQERHTSNRNQNSALDPNATLRAPSKPLDRRQREKAIAHLAEQQHGLISINQLADLGASRALAARRVSSGYWQRDAPSVFRIGAAPISMEQRLMAATLSLGSNAMVSHRAAAWLWGLRRTRQTPIEVSVPRQILANRRGMVLHRVRDLHLAAPTTINGIPVTGLVRTLLDVAAVEPRQSERLIMLARREHKLSWEELRTEVNRHITKGRSGAASVRAALDKHFGDAVTDSGTEDKASIMLLNSKRIPRPLMQAPICCADGVIVHPDFFWPEYNAVLEVLGIDHFINEQVQQKDLHRRNQIELAGYRFLAYSGQMLKRHPARFLADVEALLRLSGWEPT